jgi:tRNA A37 methylthiotransferase MiaB
MKLDPVSLTYIRIFLIRILRKEFINQNLNSEEEVLIETQKDGFYEGFTGNYIKCYVKDDVKLENNSLVKVKLVKPYLDGVLAEII